MSRQEILIILLVLVSGYHLQAQDQGIPIQVGYYAPFGIHLGAKVGSAFTLKSWSPTEEEGRHKIHALEIQPQIGYFQYPTVQENLLVNAEIVYRNRKSDKRFYRMASIGLGYIAGFQRQGGTVDLSTGDIAHDVETLHQFAPTINLGFGKDPSGKLGYYFKVFYGGQLGGPTENAAFFGAEVGLAFWIAKNN